MSSVTCDFSTAYTGVFWDLEDCPVPPGLSPGSIFDNIKLALNNRGYTGTVSIVAYSLEKLEEEEFESAGIGIVHLENFVAKRVRMFRDVFMWGLQYRLTNFMVISRDIFDDNDFVAALLLLKEKEHNVLLALPDEPSHLLRRVSSSHWLWASLASGGRSPQVVTPSLCVACKKQMKPLHEKRGKNGKGRKRTANPQEDETSKKAEDYQKRKRESSVETMSSVTCDFSTAETCVFWDLEYCPVPPGLTPGSIFDNIQLALNNMGYTGMLSIVAYSLEKLKEEDFESAGIKILQLENRGAKREKMFVDFFLWGIDHRSEPTNLMVISRDITGDKNYCEGLLELNKNNVLLAFPERPSELLPRYPSSVWLWASLAAGRRPLSLHKKRGKYAKGRKRRANPQADETSKKRKMRANTNSED